jgi:phosphatidate phosphatase APP1
LPAAHSHVRHRHWLIEPYLGYGTPRRLIVSGRVLRDKGAIQSTRFDSRWRNLRHTFRRFATGEIAGARVRAIFRNAAGVGVTDGEGYFLIDIDVDGLDPTRCWHEVALELEDAADLHGPIATAKTEVLVAPSSARFGVISDIDDTVVATNATSTLKMLATVLFSNAHVRMPFEGIAPFYRALHAGVSGDERNPLFYVSNGPWNLYGLLLEFFGLNGVPPGPLFLRDFGPHILFARKSGHSTHKLLHIGRILETYGHLPFILIGDSGERDPEIYSEIVQRYPNRIRAIYIRSVDQRPERLRAIAALAARVSETTTQFVLAQDSASAAAHAAGEGLIASSALASIASKRRL